MQSRRKEEHVEVPRTVVKSHNQQHKAAAAAAEVGPLETYPVSRREAMNNRSRSPREAMNNRSRSPREAMNNRSRSPPASHGRRSYSPNSRGSIRDRMSGSMVGRRDSYGRHLGNTEMGARSKSPLYEQMRKKPHYEDGEVVNRKYDYVVNSVGFDERTNSRERGVYRFDHHGPSRMNKEVYMENRVSSMEGHVMMDQKFFPQEEMNARRPHRLPQDLRPPRLNFAETSEQLPYSSQDIDIGQYERDKFRQRETIPSKKVMVMDSYREDKPMFDSRDVAYSRLDASQSKDLMSTSQLKNFAGTSSGRPRTEFLHSYQDDAPLHVSEEHFRSNRKLTEPVGYNKYDQRPLTDSVRDPEPARRNMPSYHQQANSPSRDEYEEYLYRKPRPIGNNNRGYPVEDFKRMMPSQSRVSYEHASVDYGHIDMPEQNILHHVVDRIDNTDHSYGGSRKGVKWDDLGLQKHISTEYIDMRRPYAPMQDREYVDSENTHVAFRRRLPQDYEMSHLDASHNHHLSNLRSDPGFGRGERPMFQNERVINSSASKYDAEQRRPGLRTMRMEDELDMYSDRILKRKFLMVEDVGRPSSRTIVSRKLHSADDFGGSYDSEEQIDEDIIGLHASRAKRYGHNEYRKSGRSYDGQEHHADSELDDSYTSEGSLAHSQRAPVGFFKNNGKYMKGNPGQGSLSWHTSHHNDRRSNLHKQNNVWKRNEDYDEDLNEKDGDMTEDLVNHAEAELSEDSEEFKQLVHEAFLKYCRRLNLNQSARKRYKEQGHAGSLFCVVCGRSCSKEFMDTQRLVTHAFMSHKAGLRAEHLGLHKAICVLLGWDAVSPPDTITWVPQVLPEAEALAQKEDLVLWPPMVVIHNISMANNNPQEQKVVPIEGVQKFLRDKGFVGGKITVCLGRPADQSVMVVKFLGTFTGLATAERLHKYFVKNKRGRIEFTSNNGENSIDEMGIEGEGDSLEEQLLYGYMAISEDLDKLDFHNRKWSLVKSKKEILDLANDPIKTDER